MLRVVGPEALPAGGCTQRGAGGGRAVAAILDNHPVDPGTLGALTALAGTVVGGGMALLQQAHASRQRRQEVREGRSREGAEQVVAILRGFRNMYRPSIRDYYEDREIDTAEPNYTDELDRLEDLIPLLADRELRVRLDEVRLALGLVEPAVRNRKSGDSFYAEGQAIAEEALELVNSYLRGEGLPKRSDAFVRVHREAVEVEAGYERERHEAERQARQVRLDGEAHYERLRQAAAGPPAVKQGPDDNGQLTER